MAASMKVLKRLPVVVILGCTGSGKSKLAIELAVKFNGEIISADSMQVYKGLDIITNKVTKEELNTCPHHVIDYVNPLHSKYTVTDFRDKALPIISDLLQRDKVPIIVGGTNYYIESLLWKFLIDNKADPDSEVAEVKRMCASESTTRADSQHAATAIDSTSSHLHLQSHSPPGGKDMNYNPVATNDHQIAAPYSTELATTSVKCDVNAHGDQLSNSISSTDGQEMAAPFSTHLSTPAQCGNNQGYNVCNVSAAKILQMAAPSRSELGKAETVTEPEKTPQHDHTPYAGQRVAGNVGPLDEEAGSSDSSVSDEEGSASRDRYAEVESGVLHQELEKCDPVSALRIHPNDRRKVIRALEIYKQRGVAMSELMAEQHRGVGDTALSGPLRYQNTCIFWIQSEQKVLDERLDRRVEAMLEQGLLKELLGFHQQYNKQRLQENREADYTTGIFQSIGFKEFHDYLLLPEDERDSTRGQHLLQKGIEEQKRVTRRYARKQTKWIRNRFLKRPGSSVPPVYAVDSTYPENWDAAVYVPACNILQAIIEGKTPSQAPLPYEESQNRPERNVCHVCDGQIFVTKQQWEVHLKSNRHKKKLARQHADRRWKEEQIKRTRLEEDGAADD